MIAIIIVIATMLATCASVIAIASYVIRKREAEQYPPSSEGLLNGNR